MNYYFFLKKYYDYFESTVDICNFSPTNLINKKNFDKLFVYCFYTDGTKWSYKLLDIVQKNCAKKFYLSKIISQIHQEPFIYINYHELNSVEEIFYNSNNLKSIPSWRANIKLTSSSTSCSYQGEYPLGLTNKASLVSCSPLFNKNSINYFSFVNIQKSPTIDERKIEILNLKKEKLGEFQVNTNSVNSINLNEIVNLDNDNFYIFKSQDIGGIPIYLNFSKDLRHLSCEHTHPPVEYLLEGDRFFFQKLKKSFWLN